MSGRPLVRWRSIQYAFLVQEPRDPPGEVVADGPEALQARLGVVVVSGGSGSGQCSRRTRPR